MTKARRSAARFIVATLVTAGLAFGMAPSNASAASTVYVGGTATCGWISSSPAQRVTITLDSGGTVAVGTSSLPWKTGRYDMSFGYMPSGGTWATATVYCNPITSYRPGNHSYRIWLKPDWRNTTGNTNFLNV